jgi:hypothetical protein
MVFNTFFCDDLIEYTSKGLPKIGPQLCIIKMLLYYLCLIVTCDL